MADGGEKRKAVASTDSMEAKKTKHAPRLRGSGSSIMSEEQVPARQLMEELTQEVCQARSDIQDVRDNLLDMRHDFAAFRTSIIEELRRLPQRLPSTSAAVSSIASLPTPAFPSDDAEPPARLPSPPHPHSSPSSDSSPAPSPPDSPFPDEVPVVCLPGYTHFYLNCHPSPLVHERLHDPTIFHEFSFLFRLPSSALRITQLLHALTIMEEEGGLASLDITRLFRFVQHFSLDGHPCSSCRRLLSTPLPLSSISSTLHHSYFSVSPTTASSTSLPADPGPSSTTVSSVSSTIPLSTQPGPSSPL